MLVRDDVIDSAKKENQLKNELIVKRCQQIDSAYWMLPLRERLKVRKQAEAELGITVDYKYINV